MTTKSTFPYLLYQDLSWLIPTEDMINPCLKWMNAFTENMNNLCLKWMQLSWEDLINICLKWMNAFNDRRLYWIWAGGVGMLGSIVDLLPEDFAHKSQAQSVLNKPTYYAGVLSWSLYYLRFGIRVGLFIKHMLDEDELSTPFDVKFAAEWKKYKFNLLNDFIWATANLAGFFWLCGNGLAGYFGNVLTAVLLLMDVSLAIWGYFEEANETHACKLDREYKLYALFVDILYAVSLLAAFALVCCLFLTPATMPLVPIMAVLWMSVSGNVLCFALNAFFAAARQALEICRLVECWNYAVDSQKELFQKMIVYQQMSLMHSLSVDLLIPPLVFLGFVFLPMGAGLAILAVGLILAVASYCYVEKTYKCEEASLPAVTDQSVSSPITTHGFFGSVAECLRKKREVSANDAAIEQISDVGWAKEC